MILRMAAESPTWGAPRIHGDLLKLAFNLSEPTVSRWLRRVPRSPGVGKRWLTFLRNHREAIAAMDRRTFIKNVAVISMVGAFDDGPSCSGQTASSIEQDITAKRIPRWRGFNLQGRFPTANMPYHGSAFDEFDFATLAEWGFNFVRLPMSYWVWGSGDNWSLIRDEPLREIDRAVDLGRQYGIHINLNFDRIPGYCINGRELEPADLFSGTRTQ